jgi:hypothetical protein
MSGGVTAQDGETGPLSLRRYTPWVAAAAAVVVVLYVAAFDQRDTAGKLAPLPFSLERYHRIQQLDDGFERRAWIYAGIVAVAMAAATVAALIQAKTLADQRRVFGQAGVAGIVLALFGIVLLWQVHSAIEPSLAEVLAPSALLFAIAGVGGAISRVQRAPPGEPSAPERRLGRVAAAALACTATTVVCAIAFAAPQDSSCSGNAEPAPGWTDAVATIGWITGGAALVLALVGLAARRWFVALVCFIVNPGALFYAILSTGVAC